MTTYEKVFKTSIEPKKKAQTRISSSNAHKGRPNNLKKAKKEKAQPPERVMEKRLRLQRSTDFKKVFKEGKRFPSPHFVLYIRKNALPQARLGVSISKSHFKLATRRNRLRRIARELFRKDISRDFKGYDFVIASKRNYPSRDMREAIKELKALLGKIRK